MLEEVALSRKKVGTLKCAFMHACIHPAVQYYIGMHISAEH